MRLIRLGTRIFFLIMAHSFLAILWFWKAGKAHESIQQLEIIHHEPLFCIFHPDSSPQSQSTAFKEVDQSPFCVENGYFSFFLNHGGSQSLKEAAGVAEMDRHVDEAQEERK